MPRALLPRRAARPSGVRRHLLASAAVQVVVAFVTAGAPARTPSLAFGILVPVYGLGLAGLWGRPHGHVTDPAGRARRTVRWVILLVGLDSIAILALHRLHATATRITSPAAPRTSRRGSAGCWVAVATAWFGVGYGIVLGYYYAVVKRNTR